MHDETMTEKDERTSLIIESGDSALCPIAIAVNPAIVV